MTKLLLDNDFDNANPHFIFDGKWGGWGPPRWFRCPPGFGLMDVAECEYTGVNSWVWKRVWINATQSWRDLTEEEILRLGGNDASN